MRSHAISVEGNKRLSKRAYLMSDKKPCTVVCRGSSVVSVLPLSCHSSVALLNHKESGEKCLWDLDKLLYSPAAQLSYRVSERTRAKLSLFSRSTRSRRVCQCKDPTRSIRVRLSGAYLERASRRVLSAGVGVQEASLLCRVIYAIRRTQEAH